MKILVAIKSDKNSETVLETLAWVGRAGFNTRIFIPDKRQLSKYQKAIDDANYHHFLSLPYTMIEFGDPLKYAEKEGYDLLVTIPDSLKRWGRTRNEDKNVIDYAVALGEARVAFGQDPEMKLKKFKNGTTMQRVR